MIHKVHVVIIQPLVQQVREKTLCWELFIEGHFLRNAKLAQGK